MGSQREDCQLFDRTNSSAERSNKVLCLVWLYTSLDLVNDEHANSHS